jgi:hypothetical protein
VNLSALDSVGHADCFVVSRSKVIKGIGLYLDVAVWSKSFDGCTMMASFAHLTFTFFDKVSSCSVTVVIQRTRLDNPL